MISGTFRELSGNLAGTFSFNKLQKKGIRGYSDAFYYDLTPITQTSELLYSKLSYHYHPCHNLAIPYTLLMAVPTLTMLNSHP